ncbi:hypothetical protein CEUSTIGMA_g4238.t1 [Chlamydomonas eustigma]|uniref:Uncharacterized protein n=1 Tax=Chlamydomonas eustigma TaxID=1157962 RepID=A0A250X1M5_9CHLO|nr:hypothetical protein CEUSTIGMA_g4238.t1 [Chlamydomonas eustigma]|eukprot:GAX76792.1 hypothetical protein CEUSTIGMA_g4238.t1 [Chlamydomonas eustigma]
MEAEQAGASAAALTAVEPSGETASTVGPIGPATGQHASAAALTAVEPSGETASTDGPAGQHASAAALAALTAVEPYGRAHGWSKYEEMSNEAVDKLFTQNYDYKGLRKPKLITIYPGQTLVFHGMLVHAGAPGVVDSNGNIIPAHRLHRYIMPKGSKVDMAKD